jgi:hypothetical protein
MKNDLTTGAWQHDIGCPISITLLSTSDEYSFVQTIADKMKLFTKQQIEGALKAHHLYETLAYPSNADFKAVL